MKLREYLKGCDAVYSTTLDPKSVGVVRLHLVPPVKLKPDAPWVCIINGYSIVPLQSAWAVLLKEFMQELNKTDGSPLDEGGFKTIISATVKNVREIFPKVPVQTLRKDLNDMMCTFKALAVGEEPSSEIGYMSLAKYSKYMSAPHRMDIMVSAMYKNGCWNCNQKCLHCYAAGEVRSSAKELDTESLKKVIDACRRANIPAITFTGGEATLRSDLVELVDYAKWFVTRLNTNGILLSKELCRKLYDASLDSVQVTLYSYDEKIHNSLVGGERFSQTVEGIKNAIEAGLDVSINTPLCSLNRDLVKTVEFAHSLGVRYFSCSGLIPTGNAKSSDSVITRLGKEEITDSVCQAFEFTSKNECEISFTSPGWIDEDVLKKMKMVVPSCGACLSNMAIAPDGEVIPCQSWLGGVSLGNILTTPWKKIWNSKECVDIRKRAVKSEQICLLKEGER